MRYVPDTVILIDDLNAIPAANKFLRPEGGVLRTALASPDASPRAAGN